MQILCPARTGILKNNVLSYPPQKSLRVSIHKFFFVSSSSSTTTTQSSIYLNDDDKTKRSSPKWKRKRKEAKVSQQQESMKKIQPFKFLLIPNLFSSPPLIIQCHEFLLHFLRLMCNWLSYNKWQFFKFTFEVLGFFCVSMVLRFSSPFHLYVVIPDFLDAAL